MANINGKIQTDVIILDDTYDVSVAIPTSKPKPSDSQAIAGLRFWLARPRKVAITTELLNIVSAAPSFLIKRAAWDRLFLWKVKSPASAPETAD